MRELAWRSGKLQPLWRKGAELKGEGLSWSIRAVHGPVCQGDREFFCLGTREAETLLVYRDKGERGMRELFLCAILPPQKTEPTISSSSAEEDLNEFLLPLV